MNNLTYEKSRLEYVLKKLLDPAKRREIAYLGQEDYLNIKIQTVQNEIDLINKNILEVTREERI
jgi:pimeloyl-CoA synthetase